jgi:hypothetical protein
MKEILRRQLELIVAKYEKLGIVTDGYENIKRLSTDDAWLTGTAAVMEKVENSEKILNISKEINTAKNDQRLDEAFAEIDTARNLATTKFYGAFDKVTYQPPEKDKRWPDLVAEKDGVLTPAEVKLLTPQDLGEAKFFQKLIDKVNNHAMPQLADYYKEHPFEQGYIFVWSYHPVQLQNLQYDDLNKWIQSKVPKQQFQVVVLCQLYGIGMWDFYV